MTLPLATTTWNTAEISALHEVIEDGMFSMGKRVKEFEKQFASFVGCKYCVMVNSGSSANLLAVSAMFYRKSGSLKAGDEVIVPAVSWSTTFHPLYQYGLKIKFVDINKDTLNMDMDQVADAISDKTKAIFAVNLLGNSVDYDRLKQIIGNRDITILEDNCESMGATLNGKQAGSFGLMGTFSSFFSHHISTMEGGMICTDDKELYHILLSLRSHGWTRHLPKDNLVCEISSDAFFESFRFVLPGYNLRPIEMSGALGLCQLKKLPSIIDGRRNNGKVFQELFKNCQGVSIQQETGKSSWFGFALLFDDGKKKRDEVANKMRSNNIECRPIVAGNYTRNPAVKYFDYSIHGTLTNANIAHDAGLFIGNHHFDITSELKIVLDLISS